MKRLHISVCVCVCVFVLVCVCVCVLVACVRVCEKKSLFATFVFELLFRLLSCLCLDFDDKTGIYSCIIKVSGFGGGWAEKKNESYGLAQ